MSQKNIVLAASHLKKYYGKGESLVKALDDVSVSMERKEIYCHMSKLQMESLEWTLE